jgi:hypothetical protein
MDHGALVEAAYLLPQCFCVAARPRELELGAGAIPVRPVERAAVE